MKGCLLTGLMGMGIVMAGLFGGIFYLVRNFDYKIKGEKVYYRRFNNMNYRIETKLIESADATSFKKLGYGYGKDKQQVYKEGRTLSGADPKSFRIHNGVYGITKDKFRVYLRG